jgi:iron complex outermembrane receptor protein
MKIKLRLFLFLFSITGLQTVLLAQQNGVLQGKITTADGKPAESITVGLANLKKTTATNQLGDKTRHLYHSGNRYWIDNR